MWHGEKPLTTRPHGGLASTPAVYVERRNFLFLFCLFAIPENEPLRRSQLHRKGRQILKVGQSRNLFKLFYNCSSYLSLLLKKYILSEKNWLNWQHWTTNKNLFIVVVISHFVYPFCSADIHLRKGSSGINFSRSAWPSISFPCERW